MREHHITFPTVWEIAAEETHRLKESRKRLDAAASTLAALIDQLEGYQVPERIPSD